MSSFESETPGPVQSSGTQAIQIEPARLELTNTPVVSEDGRAGWCGADGAEFHPAGLVFEHRDGFHPPVRAWHLPNLCVGLNHVEGRVKAIRNMANRADRGRVSDVRLLS